MKPSHESLRWRVVPGVAIALIAASWVATSCTENTPNVTVAEDQAQLDGGFTDVPTDMPPAPVACVLPERSKAVRYATKLVEQGEQIFRYDTFGDEAFWGDTLGLHRAIAGEQNGGVGLGVSPKTALEVGLKVDSEALPRSLVDSLQRGEVDLSSPNTTLALLKLNAVVGVTGFFDGDRLKSVGIQCALCHSTVDDSLGAGIGKRLDGWANRDLNVGAIIALSPDVSAISKLLSVSDETTRKVLNSWGPGHFNAELFLDGKAFKPDGTPAYTMMPAIFGLAGTSLHTYEGWGGVSHWNAFVANLLMGGKGTFFDPRLNNADKFPVATRNKLYDVRNTPDQISSKLPALQMYQLSLAPPKAPDNFNRVAASRGQTLFEGKARCASCHVPPTFMEPGWPMHTAKEIGIDDFQSQRSPDNRYRTSPLAGLWSHAKGGFYHDGRFERLSDVINHYDTTFQLGLNDQEKNDLAEYLNSL
jgi:cytochrome c peroxidase